MEMLWDLQIINDMQYRLFADKRKKRKAESLPLHFRA